MINVQNTYPSNNSEEKPQFSRSYENSNRPQLTNYNASRPPFRPRFGYQERNPSPQGVQPNQFNFYPRGRGAQSQLGPRQHFQHNWRPQPRQWHQQNHRPRMMPGEQITQGNSQSWRGGASRGNGPNNRYHQGTWRHSNNSGNHQYGQVQNELNANQYSRNDDHRNQQAQSQQQPLN